MCGITFILDKNRRGVEPSAILQSNRALQHRGPDHSDYYSNENVHLGHTRLKIVDIEGGDQPFFSEDRSIVSICNGEIYNFESLRETLISKGHTFRSKCDSEVVVHLYEEDPEHFTEKLDGMFAFILVDYSRRKVIVGRDRVGIKPFVLYEDKDWLIGSSEVKGIYATGLAQREFDSQAIYDSFTFGYVPGEATGFKNVRRVSPGTVQTFDFDGKWLGERSYFHPEFASNSASMSVCSAPWARKLRRELSEAVDSHRMGDVPVSSYLSGGIDSTVVTYLLRELLGDSVPLKSFSIAFDNEVFDESDIFRRTTELWGLDSHVAMINDLDFGDFLTTISMIEQPQFTPIDYPMFCLSRLIHQQGIKVALVGEGSDELFGGYLSFTLAKLRRFVSVFKSSSSRRTALGLFMSYMIADPTSQRNFLNAYSHPANEAISRFGTYPAWYPFWLIGDQGKDKLFQGEHRPSLGEGSAIERIAEPLKSTYKGISEFDKSIYLELKTRLPNYILHRSDRNAMAHSVEVRVPFLSRGMLNLALRIPPRWKMYWTKEKYILRRAFLKEMPSHVLQKRKQGFNAPHELIWVKNEEALESYLSKAAIESCGLFRYERIKELRSSLVSDETKHNYFLRERIITQLTGVLTTQMLHERLIRGDFTLPQNSASSPSGMPSSEIQP